MQFGSLVGKIVKLQLELITKTSKASTENTSDVLSRWMVNKSGAYLVRTGEMKEKISNMFICFHRNLRRDLQFECIARHLGISQLQ